MWLVVSLFTEYVEIYFCIEINENQIRFTEMKIKFL